MNRPWPAGSATAVGSLPGTDPDEAMRIVLGELPDLPHLPELPERGVCAGMIGRAAALLVDLPVEVAPSGWRLTSRPGRELRLARDLLARDLDALQAHAAGHVGPLKLQVAGPWTLAAGIEVPAGHRIVTDHGASRDLAESLAEGVRLHVAEIRARVPGAVAVLQLDEPSLPSVLAGTLPTASGYGTVRSVEPVRATEMLRSVLAVVPAGARVVHCCADRAPLALLRDAGADALCLDAGLIGRADYDTLGEAVDAGVALWLGVVPTTGPETDFAAARDRITGLWSELGFDPAAAAGIVTPVPACGLAGVDPDRARRSLRVVREVGRALRDLQ